MPSHKRRSSPQSAIFKLAEIKAAIDAFDRGESNVFDALDAISVAVAAHEWIMPLARRDSQRRDAA